MSKFNITLLCQVAVKVVGVEAKDAAAAVHLTRPLVDLDDQLTFTPAEGFPHSVTFNDETQYVMVDHLRGSTLNQLFGNAARDMAPDPASAEAKDIERTDWFMLDGPADLRDLLMACRAVLAASEDENAKAKIVGTTLAAAVHNLRVALDELPPPLPPEAETKAPDAAQ